MRDLDTICGISTQIGESGISIIRISGNGGLNILSKIFKTKKNVDILSMASYTMKHGFIVDDRGETIDEVIVSYMRGPKSFTAEDVVEINCHGGIVSVNRVLKEVLKCGARLSDRGEFTKRAFLNGRIDLSQAEAVFDIISSKTDLSMDSALKQSMGSISYEIQSLREELISIIAHIEATVDFPEDDIEEITCGKVKELLIPIIDKVNELIHSFEVGRIVREGIKVAIIGKPNVGKSSLLNALLKEDRAIVTEVPGTTRDTIEELINIDGLLIKIIDTAGIRNTSDVVEKIGVDISFKKIDESDLVLLIIDSKFGICNEDEIILNYIDSKKHILVFNKIDLINKSDFNYDKNSVLISAKTGEGIDDLKNKIYELFLLGEVKNKKVSITNVRHSDVLIRASMHLNEAMLILKDVYSIDLASIDLRNAWTVLGEITGDSIKEEIIDEIFSKFCLGK